MSKMCKVVCKHERAKSSDERVAQWKAHNEDWMGDERG